MTKHICVINWKGGCGKTTIATHLAVALATSGLETGLADYDRQRPPNSGRSYGQRMRSLYPWSTGGKTLVRVLPLSNA